MSVARIVILLVALVAGIGAAVLIQRPSDTPVVVAEPKAAPTVPVMVASSELPVGHTVQAGDIAWVDWPLASVPPGVIRRDEAPEADKEITGQLARFAILAKEPIRRERLIRTDGTGFLSAVLPQGMRAMAISTDSRGANTAGGFVLPNDRVDVLRTYSESRQGQSESFVTETLVQNVRVLAIGQNVQERNGEKVVIGETATLELDPRQTEIVAQGQRSGTLSLALRSLKDANEPARQGEEGSLTLVRFGVTSKSTNP